MGLGRGRRRDPDGRADPRAGPAAAEARLLTNVPWSPGGTQRGDRHSDPDALRAFALACQSELAAATAELQAAKLAVQLRTLEIEKLKFQIAKLRRMQFGRSSERLTRQIEQLELRLEELEAGEAGEGAKGAAGKQALPQHQ